MIRTRTELLIEMTRFTESSEVRPSSEEEDVLADLFATMIVDAQEGDTSLADTAEAARVIFELALRNAVPDQAERLIGMVNNRVDSYNAAQETIDADGSGD